LAEILSQEEINALIEAYKATGGSEEHTSVSDREVRSYDFARPDKFCKEHLRALNLIHNKHGASLAAALTNTLRIETQMSLLALDQLTYKDYCSTLPEGTVFVEVSLEPLTSIGVFEFNPLLVSMCVELLAGSPIIPEKSIENITEIDRAIMKPIVDLSLRKYAEAWAATVPVKAAVKSLTTESATRQVLLPSEPVLICCYEVTFGGRGSLMSICLPAAAIEAVLPVLTLGMSVDKSASQVVEVNPELMRTFEEVSVNCRAVLGTTRMPVSEVANLEEGDLIQLPVKSESPAQLWVENVPVFLGALGKSGRVLALKITETLKKTDLAA